MGLYTREMPPVIIEEVTFPEADYRSLRKRYESSSVTIPHKPHNEPAWDKHNSELPPKSSRFRKLNTWDHNTERVQQFTQWALIAAGAAATLAPAVIKYVH